MSYELKPKGGTIFKNAKKTEAKHPDYRGEIMTPKGEKLSISLWVKDGTKGKYFSASVDVPYVNQEAKNTPAPIVNSNNNDMDLPF